MEWSQLGSIFCLELVVGTFAFLALSHPAPLTPFFFRLNGAFAIAALVGAWWFRFLEHFPAGLQGDLIAYGSIGVVLFYLISCAPVRSVLRRNVLWLAVLSALTALFGAVASVSAFGLGTQMLFTLSVAFSGLIVGGVGISMAVGHSYLTVPGMEIFHLSKLNWATAISMGLKLACALVLFFLFLEDFQNEDSNLLRPMGLFFAGTRVLVGVILPFVFALMVIGCLKHQGTRSATGILYASTIFVIVGEALGYSLWNTYGVPF